MKIVVQVINGAGLFIGFIGAIILWKYSYGYESICFYGTIQNPDGGISKRNKRRQLFQRVGFCCIAFGFALQFVGVLI